MQRHAPGLNPTQQAWITVFATAFTLLLVIVLAALG